MNLKFIYTIFVGILVATFIGLGIAAFYPAPKAPEFPKELQEPPRVISTEGKVVEETPEQKAAREKFDAEQKIFETARNGYARNVFIIAVILAVVVLVISLTIARQIDVIADGLLLGGTLTLFYGIVRGFETEDAKFRFLAATVGLIVTLTVGYLKFIKHSEK